MKAIRHALEAAAVGAGIIVLGLLPRRAAAALGAALARGLGPLLPVSRVARRNIARALPDADAAAIVRAMWDNLGRVAAEYPYLAALGDADIAIEGRAHLDAARAGGRAVLFVSAHFGNWEILPVVAARLGLPLHLVYRPANNPRVERLVQRRRAAVRGTYHPKGAAGARGLIRAIQAGESVALLADQKMNDGIAVPFFGRPAMTAPAVAELAIRHGLPVVPALVMREGARFRVVIEPPLAEFADAPALMAAINGRFEAWIRARPGHWLWLHRRWPDP